MWLSWQHQIAQDCSISKVGKGGEQSQASVSLRGMFWGMEARPDPPAFPLCPQLGTVGLSRVVWRPGGWLAQGPRSGARLMWLRHTWSSPTT